MRIFNALRLFGKCRFAKAVVLGIALGWSLLGAAAVYAERHITPDKLAFDSVGDDGTIVTQKACRDAVDRFTGHETKKLSWRQDGVLIVDATSIYGCGYVVRNPQSSIAGTQVTLAWDWYVPENGYLLGCACAYDLQFIVPKAAGIKSPTIKFANE